MSNLENIELALDSIAFQLDNPSKVSIDMDEDNNFYWVLKGIEMELGRIADALENKNKEEG